MIIIFMPREIITLFLIICIMIDEKDVFNKFKDEKGSFKDHVTREVEGILSLYEASYLRVDGEKILEEALAFTTHHLTCFVKQSSSSMVEIINHALSRPLFRCVPRLEATYQISFYESQPFHDKILLRFAKIDFDLLQLLHKQELQDLCRWWKKLDFPTKLPYARDRFITCYFWMLSMFPEPKYSKGRIVSTKLLKMVSVIDDTYDAYGTIPELEIFTDAIERWDKSYMIKLPEYMKLIYGTLLDIVELLKNDLEKEGRSFVVYYVQQAWKGLCNAYMQETKWCHEKYVPTFDEYIKNAKVSSSYYVIMAASYAGMEIAKKDAFEWLFEKPGSAQGTCVIGRILNDLASYKFEKERTHVATAVECYVKQFGGSEEEAYEKLIELVDEGWKDVIQDMFQPTKVSMRLFIQVLNLARISDEMYTIDRDGYTIGKITQAKLEALLINNYATFM